MNRRVLTGLMAVSVVVAASVQVEAAAPRSRRVSVKSNGTGVSQGSDGYIDGLSDDGRKASFASTGAFVSADDNGFGDVYLRNLQAGKTRWASLEGDGNSDGPAISGNGRFVVFWSEASNLVSNDTNNNSDIFTYNVSTKNIQLVSKSTNGTQAGGGVGQQPTINRSGRFVAFDTGAQLVNKDNNHVSDVYLRDRERRKTHLISVDSQGNDTADGNSTNPSINASGRYITYQSDAEDLTGNDGNKSTDAFLFDRMTERTRLISVNNNGKEKPGYSVEPSVSADGRLVAFEAQAELVGLDSNGVQDIYLRNIGAQRTILITKDKNGGQANDRSDYPSISPNGRMVGFFSYATDLIATDPDGNYSAYVFDRRRGRTIMVDRKNSGAPGDMLSYVTGMSNRFVLFTTSSALAGSDGNGMNDVYRRGPLY